MSLMWFDTLGFTATHCSLANSEVETLMCQDDETNTAMVYSIFVFFFSPIIFLNGCALALIMGQRNGKKAFKSTRRGHHYTRPFSEMGFVCVPALRSLIRKTTWAFCQSKDVTFSNCFLPLDTWQDYKVMFISTYIHFHYEAWAEIKLNSCRVPPR